MSRFVVGEEVRFDGETYVVSTITDGDPPTYRLLASRPGGTRFVWVSEIELGEMENYLSPVADTDRI